MSATGPRVEYIDTIKDDLTLFAHADDTVDFRVAVSCDVEVAA